LERLVNLKHQDVSGGVLKNAARKFLLFFGELKLFVVAEMLTRSEMLQVGEIKIFVARAWIRRVLI
jgi:hypothetical protein